MDSQRSRVIVGGLALVAVVVLFIVLSGGGDDSSTTTSATTPTQSGSGSEAGVATIIVKDGQPVGGVQKLTFTQPEDIRFKVDSDTADEVHFHGYDVGRDVEAGGSVSFDVPSTITGVFEVELENAVVPLAEITVNPG